jgi:hypothetical protein
VFVEKLGGGGLKEVLAFGLAFTICRLWDFDAVSVVVLSERTTGLGHAITAGVIAGGSKASIKLFHDVFGAVSSAQKKKTEYDKAQREVAARTPLAPAAGGSTPSQGTG